jgi:hypothetical protein
MTDSAILLSQAQAHCEPGPLYIRAIADAANDLRRWFDRGFDPSYVGVDLDAKRLRSLLDKYSSQS